MSQTIVITNNFHQFLRCHPGFDVNFDAVFLEDFRCERIHFIAN